MTAGSPIRTSFLALAAIPLLSGFQASPKLGEDFAATAKAYLAMGLPIDWDGLEKVPNTKWAALPATSLKNCLPNGDCFARQGMAALGGQSQIVVATGARTMVMSLMFRNGATAMGETATIAALKQAGIGAELARCPIKPGVGGTSWYRLKGERLTDGILSIQPAGVVLSHGNELPPLQPNVVSLYTEQCAAGAERKPVSTLKPHQLLAELVVALLPPAAGPPFHDWKTLPGLMSDIKWNGDAPKPMDLSIKGDKNPMALTGEVSLGGRKFSLIASGTATQVKNLYLDEQARHPRGEHMLGVVYEKGIAVKLVRCGPIYTESTNNWYSLNSGKTRPAMIRQSINYDGNMVGDAYELRLDGTLPARDGRDREPGVNGCA